jgi:hypothetical protein
MISQDRTPAKPRTRRPILTSTLVGATVAALWLSGNSGAQKADSEKNDAVTFAVGRCDTLKMLEGVDVLAVRRDGRIDRLGRTDTNGHLTVKRAVISEATTVTILFCGEKFFCGAFTQNDTDFSAAGKLLIHLAPFAVQ